MEEKIDALGILEKAIEATPTTEGYIADLERQLAETKAEIEAMRPVVRAAGFHKWKAQLNTGTSSDPDHCDVCHAFSIYESRKQP